MKFVRMLVAASLIFASTSVPTLVQAKSIKWSCVEISPGHFVCSPSLGRP